MNRDSAIFRSDGVTLMAAAFAILVWSSSFAAIAYGLTVFTPAELSLFRFLVASAVLAVPVALGAIKLPPVRDWPAILALGFVGISIYQLTLGYAMTRISVGAAAVVIALSPGVTSALAALRLGERISGSTIAGLGVAFSGVVLITVGAGRAVRFEPMTLLVLVSVLATSIYFVWQKPLLARNPESGTLGFTAASIFAGTLGLLPFGLSLPMKLATVPAPHIWSAVYLGVVPTIIGYLCWNFALSRATASRVSSFLYVQPLVASAIAWLCLGQVPGMLTAIGGALAIGGVVLTVRTSGKVVPPRRIAPVVVRKTVVGKNALAVTQSCTQT